MDTQDPYNIQLITTIVIAVANIFLVGLTSVYVYLTRRMVLEMRNAKDPSIYFDLELPDREMRMAIRNSGQSPARNIRFNIEDTAPWHMFDKGKTSINDLKVIKDGISYLPPNRTLKYFVGTPIWDKIDDKNALIKVDVTFENENGKIFNREYNIDLNQYNSVLFESFRDPNRDVAKAIRDAESSRQSHDRTNKMVSNWSRSATKRCPVCGETIPESAKKCSHCLEFLDPEKPKDLNAS